MFKFNFKKNSFDKEKIIQLFETSLEKYTTKEEIHSILDTVFNSERLYLYCSENPYQDYEFEFSYNLIDQAKEFLNNQEAMFFAPEIDSFLKKEPFGVNVDIYSDPYFNSYLIIPILIEKTIDLNISNMLPDFAFIENLLNKNKINIQDLDEELSFFCAYQDLTEVETSNYQVGGYQNYFVNMGYYNFIGHFDGNYSSGILSIHFTDRGIYTCVGM